MNEEYKLVTCPHCGQPAPSENLRCIYCGERLNEPVGMMSGLLLGRRRLLGIILIVLVLIVFLIWLL